MFGDDYLYKMNFNFAATFHAKDPSTSKELALVEYTPPSIRYNNTHPPSQGSYVLSTFVFFFVSFHYFCMTKMIKVLINDYIYV